MVNVVCIGKYNTAGKFDDVQWFEILTGLSGICDCIIIYTESGYDAIKSTFGKYCEVQKLGKPDSVMQIEAFRLIIKEKGAWEVISECNFCIDSADAISHMYFYTGNKYIGSLEVEDYENYILLELCPSDLKKIEEQMSCLSQNEEICTYHKEDVTTLAGDDKWKALGRAVMKEDKRNSRTIHIRHMNYEDIPRLCELSGYVSGGDQEYLKRQLDNQENKECSALLAFFNEQIAGYVFLYYKCRWGALKNRGLPAVVDLVVFEEYRRNGIGMALMDAAEGIAREHGNKVYLDVCLNSDYGPAQRLYIKRGYIPDGKGVYYEEEVCKVNADCKNDDELTLCLIKELV